MDSDTLHFYKAVECTGRQGDSDVYIFGQFNKHGDRIPAEQQQYVWIPHILSKLGSIVNPLPDQLPNVQHPLTILVDGLQSVAGDNAIGGVTLLSKLSE